MNINLKGKNVLVTGASRGIGLALVERFLDAEAAKVYAVCIDGPALAKLKEAKPSIETVELDLTKWEETKEKLSTLDVVHCLVNCAGVVEFTHVGEITESQWDFHFNVNTKALFNVSQIICNKLVTAGEKGSVVNISSIASHRYAPDHLVYSASKAAVDNITCTLAVDYGRKGIRFNAINPTIVFTPMGIKMWSDPAKLNPILARTPLGRCNTTDDVADVVLFLLSDRSAMINGVILPVDGGYNVV